MEFVCSLCATFPPQSRAEQFHFLCSPDGSYLNRPAISTGYFNPESSAAFWYILCFQCVAFQPGTKISKTRLVILKILLGKLKNVRQKYDWQSALENCASEFNNVAHSLQFRVFHPHFCWSGRWHNHHPGPLIPQNTKSSFKGLDAPHPRSQKDSEPPSSLQSLRRAVRRCTPGKPSQRNIWRNKSLEQKPGVRHIRLPPAVHPQWFVFSRQRPAACAIFHRLDHLWGAQGSTNQV